ncbi:MAG TPA: MBL fold metallo-hydrolase [Vicinamibacterales bacterium]|nr:MBL fold metallo-hydrolase [Vicinamibacterales bacterium]
MIVKRFFEPLLAQASYLIGCGVSHDAIVIDPHRDADVYLRAAAEDNLKISYVTESHIHADYLSGTRELAARTKATMLLSDEGDAGWKYAFADEGRLIRNGDRIKVGNVVIDVVHTPGHTPEHVTFLVTDGAVANEPIAALTGDFIFVGDVGRPDLLERAANITGTMEKSARVLYRSLQSFNRHEPWLQIWPGHGAGSACGKGISAVPYSTLGYERRFNWAFKTRDEDDFVSKVLEGQPDPPKYFVMMKRLNKEGPRVLGCLCTPRRLDDEALGSVVAGGALVIDVRSASDYAAGYVPGTLNIPLNNSFVTWAGWFVPYTQDSYLLLGEGAESRLDEAVRALALIGLDRIAGYFSSSALRRVPASDLARIPQLSPRDAAQRIDAAHLTILDVRSDIEWKEEHLPGALHIPLGQLEERAAELPKQQLLVTQCQSGNRSSIAASVLRRAGFNDVSNMAGGLSAWETEGLPVERNSSETAK